MPLVSKFVYISNFKLNLLGLLMIYLYLSHFKTKNLMTLEKPNTPKKKHKEIEKTTVQEHKQHAMMS